MCERALSQYVLAFVSRCDFVACYNGGVFLLAPSALDRSSPAVGRSFSISEYPGAFRSAFFNAASNRSDRSKNAPSISLDRQERIDHAPLFTFLRANEIECTMENSEQKYVYAMFFSLNVVIFTGCFLY